MMVDDSKLKKKSLRISVLEGIFANAMVGFTQDYFTPFLLLLGGTVQQVSFLNALPNFAASLVQLKSAGLVEWFKSRKKMINFFLFLQILIFIPMIGFAFYGWPAPVMFIGLVVLFISTSAVTSPAWSSLMSDLVDKDKRGRYFGWRNRLLGFAMTGAMFIAGLLLYIVRKTSAFKAFALVFALAFIWRIVSWYYLQKMYEPPLEDNISNHFTFFQFLKRLKKSNFAKFVLFVALLNFSVNIASPFFAVFMLRELKFNYFLFTVVTITSTLTIYGSIARWGRHADKTGNLKVIKITAPLIGFIPLLWILGQHPLYLIGAQVFAGFIWAGFNLCTANFIYDAVMPEKRTRCIAYFNTLNGVALCIGAILGGFLLPVLPPLFGHKILMLFAISSFLRIFVGALLPHQLKEVRPVETIKSDQLFFSMIGIRPMLGVERKTIRY